MADYLLASDKVESMKREENRSTRSTKNNC